MNGRRARAIRKAAGVRHVRLARERRYGEQFPVLFPRHPWGVTPAHRHALKRHLRRLRREVE